PQNCSTAVDSCNWCPCVDDVGFIELMLDRLETGFCIDRRRVFATGFSSGAMMTYRLACESDRFAAIAPVGGTLARGFNCSPAGHNAVSLLHIHGSRDRYVDVINETSQDGYHYEPLADVIASWADHQGCEDRISAFNTPFDGVGGLACTQHANCGSGAEVAACWWRGAHSWPDTGERFGTRLIWQFFQRNPQPVLIQANAD
ncbi:MAG: hypothetical protein AAF420_11730, partial [Pseudomonadota bacterium]